MSCCRQPETFRRKVSLEPTNKMEMEAWAFMQTLFLPHRGYRFGALSPRHISAFSSPSPLAFAVYNLVS